MATIGFQGPLANGASDGRTLAAIQRGQQFEEATARQEREMALDTLALMHLARRIAEATQQIRQHE